MVLLRLLRVLFSACGAKKEPAKVKFLVVAYVLILISLAGAEKGDQRLDLIALQAKIGHVCVRLDSGGILEPCTQVVGAPAKRSQVGVSFAKSARAGEGN